MNFLYYKYFTKLHHINLSKNNLKIIPQKYFQTFPNLQTLILSKNKYLKLQNFYNTYTNLNKTNITIIITNNINQINILYPLNHTLSNFLSNTSLKKFHFKYNKINILKKNFLKKFPHTIKIISIKNNQLHLNSKLTKLKNISSLKSLNINFQYTTIQSLQKNKKTKIQQKINYSTSTNTKNHILKILPPNLKKLLSKKTKSKSYYLPKLNFNKTNLKYLNISKTSYFS